MNTTEPKGRAERPSEDPRPANWGLVLDLGFRLGLSVLIGIGAGILLDNWLDTKPIFTLVGVAVGFGAAMYSIWDVARRAMRRP
jgi:F0F1-type ATP synthase assembly protein I